MDKASLKTRIEDELIAQGATLTGPHAWGSNLAEAIANAIVDEIEIDPAVCRGFGAPLELTISGGKITVVDAPVSFRSHTIDTENDDGTDDLYNINGGNPGELLMLQAEDDARTIVCRKGISLRLQRNFTFNNVQDILLLKCESEGVWYEISRSSSGD